MTTACGPSAGRLAGSGQAGFTLVEVLVASIVLIVGVVGVLGVLPQSLRSAKRSAELSVINHLASQQMEYLRSIDYGHVDLATGTHPTQSTDSAGARYYAVPGFSEDYSMRWIVGVGPTDKSGSAESKMKTVTIEVTWLTRYQSNGTVIDNPLGLETTLQTFLSE